jgi:hypothetical protein
MQPSGCGDNRLEKSRITAALILFTQSDNLYVMAGLVPAMTAETLPHRVNRTLVAQGRA